MKKLVNRSDRVVEEMIEGLVALNPDISRVRGANVVVRSDDAFDPASKVSLISGGGSGHEPAHAGYVGQGMLSAAVAGPVFTSPTAKSVYAAIEAVAGDAGVLLIVKNYTGDRLNFGFAAEQARAGGLAIETVVVADDVALVGEQDASEARGIAGTLFVHKIAGAAAEDGLTLGEVSRIARGVAADTGSMGLSLSAGTSPVTGVQSFTLAENEVELGLGIHGEPGAIRMNLEEAEAMVRRMMESIIAARGLKAKQNVAVMVNNLGATTPMELAIVARAAANLLRELDIEVARLYAGTFLTSLDMAGVSISLLLVDKERLEWLDAPTGAPAWPRVAVRGPGNTAARTITVGSLEGEGSKQTTGPQNDRIRAAVDAACQALIAAEDQLTQMDRDVGDGDLGNNMARAARAISNRLNELPTGDEAELLHAIGLMLRDELGGSSGPLYGVLFLKTAAVLKTLQRGPLAWGAAIGEGCTAITAVGGAERGDRTMLDALIPFAESLGAGRSLTEAADEAERSALETASVVARRGRTRYLRGRALGKPDPGAIAAAIWLQAVAISLAGQPR